MSTGKSEVGTVLCLWAQHLPPFLRPWKESPFHSQAPFPPSLPSPLPYPGTFEIQPGLSTPWSPTSKSNREAARLQPSAVLWGSDGPGERRPDGKGHQAWDQGQTWPCSLLAPPGPPGLFLGVQEPSFSTPSGTRSLPPAWCSSQVLTDNSGSQEFNDSLGRVAARVEGRTNVLGEAETDDGKG